MAKVLWKPFHWADLNELAVNGNILQITTLAEIELLREATGLKDGT